MVQKTPLPRIPVPLHRNITDWLRDHDKEKTHKGSEEDSHRRYVVLYVLFLGLHNTSGNNCFIYLETIHHATTRAVDAGRMELRDPGIGNDLGRGLHIHLETGIDLEKDHRIDLETDIEIKDKVDHPIDLVIEIDIGKMDETTNPRRDDRYRDRDYDRDYDRNYDYSREPLPESGTSRVEVDQAKCHNRRTCPDKLGRDRQGLRHIKPLQYR